MKNSRNIMRSIALLVVLSITGFGCVGTAVHFADVPVESLDLTRGRAVNGSASGFQLLWFIPIGVNGRHAAAYADLKQAAGTDYITDIQIKESWTYGFVGTLYSTTFTATAYPDKNASTRRVAEAPAAADVHAAQSQSDPAARKAEPVKVAPEVKPAATPDDGSLVKKLKVLKEAREAGLITETDYEQKKAELLKGM